MCKGGEGSTSGHDLEQGTYMPELHSAWPTICIACKERRPEAESETMCCPKTGKRKKERQETK